MKKEMTHNEWKKIISESIKNKPNLKGEYPSNIVRNRELLLFGQVELAKIETGKNIKFHAEAYQTIMKHYFKQKYSMNKF